MAIAVRVPRVNTNDDSVRLTRVLVEPGAAVEDGQPVAEVATDKATFVIDAPAAGRVLDVCGEEGQLLDIGAILAWIGDAGEAPAEDRVASLPAHADASRAPTLGARLLLSRYGLDPSSIPSAQARLSIEDVRTHVARHGLTAVARDGAVAPALPPSMVPGTLSPLRPAERGMLRTVSWQQSTAAPAYVELRCDAEPWLQYARAFQAAHELLFNPLLSLMSWKLAQIAAQHPAVNSTVVGHDRYVYDEVNLGMTVHSGSALYLIVIRQADRLSARDFCDRVTTLQRDAMRDSLDPETVSGATLAFTSMARWNVSRHVPLLPPHTSLIVAHSAPAGGEHVLGATYDHRSLCGADAAAVLAQLGEPPAGELSASEART